MQLRGLGRITLRPLTDELPCIGAVTVTLMEAPYVDFTLRLMGSFDLMQIPGVNQALSYGIELVGLPASCLISNVLRPICPCHQMPHVTSVLHRGLGRCKACQGNQTRRLPGKPLLLVAACVCGTALCRQGEFWMQMWAPHA